MTSSKKQITCDEIEKEIFLLVDGDLSKNRINAIKHHLETCASCKNALEEFRRVNTAYNDLPKEDLDDSIFQEMIRKVTNDPSAQAADRKRYFQKGKSMVEMFGFYRLTFGGAAIAAALILIIISFINEPDIEKRVPNELLDWSGKKITNKIEKIENQIITLKSDEWDIYIVRRNKKENWDATIKSIQNQINKLKKSTNNKEL